MADDNRRRPLLPFGDDPLFLAIGLVVVATLIFLVAPGLDLAFSRLFYEPGAGFPHAADPVLLGMRSFSDALIKLAAIVLVASLVLRLAAIDLPGRVPPRVALFLLSTLALGPGLLVNGLLKGFWGRPRPRSVDVFGGDLPYVGVWNIVDGHAGNNSFVSGEASSAIWLTAFALVVPADYRLPVLAVTIPFALAASLGRIAVGGHFLSDILISWGLTLTVIFVMYRLLVERPPAALSDERLDAGLDRIGAGLRRGAGDLVARLRAWSGR